MNAASTVPEASHGNGEFPDASQEQSARSTSQPAGQQASRKDTKAITVHLPGEVRRQLKGMAGEQGRDLVDMVAEGLNLLFAKYNKPELAPRKLSK